MNIQNILDLIPTDLLQDIFSRLPAKSVGRCRCVSKILASILGSEDFKQLFLNRSLTRPLLLFALSPKNNRWTISSSPQPQNLYEEKSSLVVTAKFSRPRVPDCICHCIYASGLLYFPMCFPTTKGEEDRSHVICNPSTGQYVIIPKPRSNKDFKSFLGFDPIDKQFKLLVMNDQTNRVNNEWVGFILTLGTGKMRWRTIKCPVVRDYSYICREGICINGVLYYLARDTVGKSYVIVCFDIRTETFKFKFIVSHLDSYLHGRSILINCKGKLGVTILRDKFCGCGVESVDLYMLVLEENVEEEKWSKYTLPSTIRSTFDLYVVGMTSTDEIVLWTRKPVFGTNGVWIRYELHYFNLEKNSLQSVELQGLEFGYVKVIMDHVEDLHVNDAEYFKSALTPLCLSDEDNDD